MYAYERRVNNTVERIEAPGLESLKELIIWLNPVLAAENDKDREEVKKGLSPTVVKE